MTSLVDVPLSGAQISAARKLLNWTPELLARRAHLAVGVVLQAERGDGLDLLPVAAARALRQILGDAGIEPGDHGQVRRRRP